MVASRHKLVILQFSATEIVNFKFCLILMISVHLLDKIKHLQSNLDIQFTFINFEFYEM